MSEEGLPAAPPKKELTELQQITRDLAKAKSALANDLDVFVALQVKKALLKKEKVPKKKKSKRPRESVAAE